MSSDNSGPDAGTTNQSVALLTGCQDRSYAVGLATALSAEGVWVDFIAGDSLDGLDIDACPGIRFINLRGSQAEDAPVATKMWRILRYYFRLMSYAATAKPKVFHILWNNKFESYDRTLLMLWYRLWKRRIVLTAHNVNAAARDGCDTWWNRLTLRIQYHLADHVFVHSERLRQQLNCEFGLPLVRTSAIPFGINNTIPSIGLTRDEARHLLGLTLHDKVALVFGQIAPYKGIHWLIRAMPDLCNDDSDFRLVIAGKVKNGSDTYFEQLLAEVKALAIQDVTLIHARHIQDEHVERYFVAADVVVLPYESIFQSGVPFVAFAFGRAVIATRVGSLPDDVVDGQNGFLCEPRSAEGLAECVKTFFRSDLHGRREESARAIREMAHTRHSWAVVAQCTRRVYLTLGCELQESEAERA